MGRGVGGALVQAHEVAERYMEPSVERCRCLVCRQHGDVRPGGGGVQVALQAGGRPTRLADANFHLVHAVAPPEGHLEGRAIGERVLGEDQTAHVAEYRVDAGRVPELIHRDQRVVEVRRAPHAAESDAVLPIAVIQDHDVQITNPFALDRIALGVDDGVVARLHVDQVLDSVVNMPRATAVDDELDPPSNAV